MASIIGAGTAEQALEVVSERSRRRRWRPPGSLAVAVLLLLLLRLPSLFEPHWYTDEAGYANTAWQMMHGKVLYLSVWNNKPPLLFWIYQLALVGFGPSEFGLHLLSAAAEAATLAAIWRLQRLAWPGRGQWVGMLAGAVLLGLPLLLGDLALPENFLIAPEAWGLVLVLEASRRNPGRDQYLLAVGAGVLAAGASLVQQTALGGAVLGVVLLAILPGRRGWAAAGLMAATGAVVVGLVLAPSIVAAGWHNVFFFVVSSYGGYTARTLPFNLLSVAPRVAAGALLAGGLVLARRRAPALVLIWGWLAVELFIYMLPNRAYPFHLLPAAVPLAVLLGGVKRPRWAAGKSLAAWSIVPLVGSALLSGGIWFGMFASSAAQGSLYTVARSEAYYQTFLGRVTGALSVVQYDDFFDRRVIAEAAASHWLQTHHLAGSTAVVWSADSWAYLLTPLKPVLPAPPIYKDFDWLGGSQLLASTTRLRPRVIVVTNDALGSFGPLQGLLDARYRKVEVTADGAVWTLRR
ncbi:MAG TPA: glycosyltransferase family 39 protein [Candidatus Dormibacteraeota bacterium]|nr:glycosyltransferase family 39 protein [Candidatus Dormibacteraeota bacterium]